MKIYLAARYSRRIELCGYRVILKSYGHTITSRWLNGEHEALDAIGTQANKAAWSFEDIEDIEEAEALFLFTEDADATRQGAGGRGGKWVEWGYALALCKRLVIIGPQPSNTFTAFPGIDVYPDLTTYLFHERMLTHADLCGLSRHKDVG